jgi:hypothetical protein
MRSPPKNTTLTSPRKKLLFRTKPQHPSQQQHQKQHHYYKVDQSILYALLSVIGFVTLIPFIGWNHISSRLINLSTNVRPTSTLRTTTSGNRNSIIRGTVRDTSAGSTTKITSSTSTSTATITTTPTSLLDDTLPLVHIVNSRFQQHGHNLTAIGQARLELFETFCLPSMLHQTIQPRVQPMSNNSNAKPTTPQMYRFLWIIKVDPALDIQLRSRLQSILEPYPNFFLVGSNNNFGASYGTGIEPGSWRNGMAGEDVLFGNVTTNVTHEYQRKYGTPIYTGDVSLLRRAHAQRSTKIILETRLDADDGLPSHYLEEIQSSAIRHLSIDPNEQYFNGTSPTIDIDDESEENVQQNEEEGEKEEEEEEEDDEFTSEVEELQGKAKWLYWCIPHSISWHPTMLENGFDPHRPIQEGDPGRLLLDTNKGNIICMTPGLTSGMSVGTQDSDMPRYSHYDLLNQLKRFTHNPRNNCGVHKLSIPCLQVLEEEAVRSRTPTSAGMKNVELSSALNYTVEEMEDQWQYMFHTFGIQRDRAVACNSYIQKNLVSILQDNLQGQCSHGHSCKTKARLQLLSMIEAAKNSTQMMYNAA